MHCHCDIVTTWNDFIFNYSSLSLIIQVCFSTKCARIIPDFFLSSVLIPHIYFYFFLQNYIHRSGRTARASQSGLAVLLVCAEEQKDYRKILYGLERSKSFMFCIINYILHLLTNQVSVFYQIIYSATFTY